MINPSMPGRPTDNKHTNGGVEKVRSLEDVFSKMTSEQLEYLLVEYEEKFQVMVDKLMTVNADKGPEDYLEDIKYTLSKPNEPASGYSRRDFNRLFATTVSSAVLSGGVLAGIASLFTYSSPDKKSGAVEASAVIGFILGLIIGGKEEHAEISEQKKKNMQKFLALVTEKSRAAKALSEFLVTKGVDSAEFFTSASEILIVRDRLKELKRKK
jgi:hypothetical protein